MDHISEECDEELTREFMGELNDAYHAVEETVFALEHQPGENGLLNDLFRTIHSVKSNLRMMHLGIYSDLMHSLEHVLDRVRQGKLAYSKAQGDLYLLTVDEIRNLCADYFTSENLNAPRCNDLITAMTQLAEAEGAAIDTATRGVIQLLDPGLLDDEFEGEGNADLALFAELAQFLQGRSSYWQGRSERQLELALEMNAEAGEPLDSLQLQAAIFLHDMGMAFLPLELLHKAEALSASEHQRLNSHPQLAANMLRQLGGWDEAATIVEQHHEHVDGSGYPVGLAGEAIGDGAKLLAIVDTFESMTHPRADREHRRSVLRAIAEINGLAGRQYDSKWVQHFNSVVRRRYGRRR